MDFEFTDQDACSKSLQRVIPYELFTGGQAFTRQAAVRNLAVVIG
jgi:hypothetical protein